MIIIESEKYSDIQIDFDKEEVHFLRGNYKYELKKIPPYSFMWGFNDIFGREFRVIRGMATRKWFLQEQVWENVGESQ
jgi:hypothetical protein